MYFSDVSGRDRLSNTHKIGLQRLRLKRGMSFIPVLNVFFRVKVHKLSGKKGVSGTLSLVHITGLGEVSSPESALCAESYSVSNRLPCYRSGT